jgi:hypothetical protein
MKISVSEDVKQSYMSPRIKPTLIMEEIISNINE